MPPNSLISNVQPIKNGQNIISSINVMLNFMGQNEMIKDNDMPLRFQNNDPSTGNILLKPILDYIKYLGKQIQGQSISYYSQEDECDVYVGIEGQSIDENYTIATDEVEKVKEQKLKLKLKIKPPQDGQVPIAAQKPLH